jgi:hypothetical protein
LIGNGLSETIQNLLAAINNSGQGACGYRDPTTTDSGYNTCYRTLAAPDCGEQLGVQGGGPQTYVTATSSANTVLLTATVAGTAGNCSGANCYLTYGWISDDTYLGDDSGSGDYENFLPASGGLTGGVDGGAAGFVVIDGQTISASVPTTGSQTGTFTANPTTGSVTITTGLGTATLAASPGTAASGTGTFSGSPTGGIVAVTNGANVMDLAASISATASATGTFNGVPTNGQTATVGGTDVVTASAETHASETAKFTGTAAAGKTVTITNNNSGNILVLTDTNPGTNACSSATTGQFEHSAADATEAANLAAAINACNTAYPAVGVTATSDGVSTTTITAAAIGPLVNPITVGTSAGAITLPCGAGPITNCALTGGNTATNTGVYFQITDLTGAALPTLTIATNFAAALTRNIGAVGIANPVTSVNNVATVTANAPGAAGNSISLASTLSNFTWTPAANLGGGANAQNTGEYFQITGSPITNATNLAAAITRNASAGVNVTGASGGTSIVTVTDNAAGGAGNNITLASYPNPTKATGSVTFNSGDGANAGDTVTIGATKYTWSAAEPPAVNQIYYSTTDANAALNLVAAVMGNAALCGDANCINAAQTANASVTASAAGAITTLTAMAGGAAGNAIVLKATFTDGATYDLNPTTGDLGGGANGALGSLVGFAWNGGNPVNLAGGVSGVTSFNSFATDGVLADDAMQLYMAINTPPNPATVGVNATYAGDVVTITTSTPGSCTGAGTLTSTATGFAWASGTLPAGSNGIASGTSFPFWGGCAELSAGAIAENIETAVMANPVLSPILMVEGANPACTTNCTFMIISNKNGVDYDYPVSTSYSSGTFGWACPAGTTVTAMCGGSDGLLWTYEGPANGETTAARTFGPSGMVIDSLDFANWVASHAYAVNARITDSNGNDQGVAKAGTSGGTAPAWCSTTGCQTVDGTVTWEYLGPSAPANLYLGTLSGPYLNGGNAAMKYTVSGLQ